MEIVFENVNYQEILKNINLIFKSGKISSLIGKNYDSKKCILDLIFGLCIADKGLISVHDTKFETSQDVKYIKNNVLYFGNSYDYNFNLKVIDDIKFGIKKIKQSDVNDLIRQFGLNSTILQKNYTELSKGETQKIRLIRAILSDKKVMIFNNPTLNLDKKGIKTLVKILKAKKKEEKVIIINSEDSNFVLQVSDEIVVIHNSQIFLKDKKLNVMSNSQILNIAGMKTPNVIDFEGKVLKQKNIKLGYRDNVDDLIKDVYRHAK